MYVLGGGIMIHVWTETGDLFMKVSALCPMQSM